MTEISNKDIKQCDVCERNSLLKWKCIDCQLSMCHLCMENIHTKFKLSETHKIISLTGSHERIKPNYCHIHRNQLYCIFCQSCDHLVCPTCLSENHSQHSLTEVEGMVMKIIARIKSFEEQIQNTLIPLCMETLSKISQLQCVEHVRFRSYIGQIMHQEERLFKHIQLHREILLTKLQQKETEIKDILLQKKKTFTINIDKMRQMKMFIDNILQEPGDMDVDYLQRESEEMRKWLSTEMSSPNEQTNQPMLPIFDSMNLNKKLISKMFGFHNSSSELSISFNKSFSLSLPSVTCMKISKNTETIYLWIGCNAAQKIEKYRILPDFKLEQEISDKKVYDMSTTISGDVLFTCSNDTCLYKAKKDGTRKLRSFAPLVPKAVYVNLKDEIHISLQEYGMNKRHSKIVTIDSKDSKEIKHYENGHNKEFFVCVTRITDDSDCLYLVDALSENLEGRIVAITKKDGLLKWAFDGHVERRFPFTPSDLVTTKVNSLVAADVRNNLIYILGNHGTLFQMIDTTKIGLMRPCCVDIDDSNLLWVAFTPTCKTAKTTDIHVFRYE
ncbi:unnamed protein product [Mytilus coruscus]|uniref:B box-type domain-containing protein n=1 Tax=Mytilus coruscus TaxID=42192 RepID=A0A6J8CCR6_MYTCO|nr:unnamed protein product [Mytilus coruscus]